MSIITNLFKQKGKPVVDINELPVATPSPVKTAAEMWKEQKFFKIEELIPKNVYHLRGRDSIELFSSGLIKTIIELRELFDAPMSINNWHRRGQFSFRGFRPWSYYNVQSFSQHSFGRAVDFDVKGYTADEARVKIREWKSQGKLEFLTGLEISSATKIVNWVHVDCRLCNLDRLNEFGLFEFTP